MTTVIERTSYWPKPGRFEDVLEVRRRACAIRLDIGLPAGEIFTQDLSDGERVVHWECRFTHGKARADDMKRRDESASFTEIRKTMNALIDNFDRAVFSRATHQPSVLKDTPIEGLEIKPEEVRFSSGGHELVGYLYLPPGDGPFPCLVTNHGSTIDQGTTDVCRPGTAAVFLGWGVASFLPHRRGYGNSPGTPWRGDVSAEYGTDDYDRQLAARLDNESDDVVAAMETVSALDAIDADHVGVIGSSFGGTVTLLAAAKSERFRCAVEFAGAAMNWEKTPNLRRLMLNAAACLTQPIYFMQAANDYSIRPTIELAAALEGTGKQVQHKVYPSFGLTRDEGHLLYGNGAAVWGSDVRGFLDRWL